MRLNDIKLKHFISNPNNYVDGVSLKQMKTAPTHPGQIFSEEWLKQSGISQAEAARKMGMSANRLNEIIAGKRRVTAETAVLFAAITNTSAPFWAYLQANYEVWHELHKTP